MKNELYNSSTEAPLKRHFQPFRNTKRNIKEYKIIRKEKYILQTLQIRDLSIFLPFKGFYTPFSI